jgi:hypothetical protein
MAKPGMYFVVEQCGANLASDVYEKDQGHTDIGEVKLRLKL